MIHQKIKYNFLTHLCRKMSSLNKPIESLIRNKLQDVLKPSYMEVFNESYMHNVPKNSETHFKVLVVSQKFEDQSLIQRHRMINSLFANELKTNIHALSIIAKTPSQWDQCDKTVDPTPPCRGGFGR